MERCERLHKQTSSTRAPVQLVVEPTLSYILPVRQQRTTLTSRSIACHMSMPLARSQAQ